MQTKSANHHNIRNIYVPEAKLTGFSRRLAQLLNHPLFTGRKQHWKFIRRTVEYSKQPHK